MNILTDRELITRIADVAGASNAPPLPRPTAAQLLDLVPAQTKELRELEPRATDEREDSDDGPPMWIHYRWQDTWVRVLPEQAFRRVRLSRNRLYSEL